MAAATDARLALLCALRRIRPGRPIGHEAHQQLRVAACAAVRGGPVETPADAAEAVREALAAARAAGLSGQEIARICNDHARGGGA